MPKKKSAKPPLIFECAWEVCHQMGGIYTVLKSKAPTMVERLGNSYLLLGPYFREHAEIEFEPAAPPRFLAPILADAEEIGIRTFFGRWLVPGRPQVILFDFRSRMGELDQDKHYLLTDHNLATDPADLEVNDCIAFGTAVFEFLRLLGERLDNRKILAHFHEWMAGIAIPRLRHSGAPVKTVFTTHATLLGRYAAGDNPHFYHHLDSMDADSAARHYTIYPRHALERLAVHTANAFTTVSEITAREASHFHHRAVDAVLPNGINVDRFAAIHEFQNLHLRYKKRIHEFVMGHFFPSYSFDLENTLYFLTSGRYEYRNKGLDLFIEALARLNHRLSQTEQAPTVVAFIITRAHTRGINVEALQRHLMFEDLKTICSDIQEGIAEKLTYSVARGCFPDFEELIPEERQTQLKRQIHARARRGLPSIVTHDVIDTAHDPILNQLRACQLCNSPDDKIKVIYHPDFLSMTNPLFNMDYDQFVRGCHLGVFPSHYEPWGYTPLECLALGLPAVTTNLSGFGNFVESHIENSKDEGIFVLDRAFQDQSQSTADLTNYLVEFCQLNRRQRVQLRNRAERKSDLFDWERLVENYWSTYEKLDVPV